MKYLKVFMDFQQVMEPLSMAKRGRLFGAMPAYAEDGTLPLLTGKERIIWPLARQNIDRKAASYQQKVKYLRRGPVTERTFSVTEEDKEKDKEKENENERASLSLQE